MPYTVEFDENARRQADSLPQQARRALADTLEDLARDPWTGHAYRPRYPRELRITIFGEWGVVVYVITEPRRRVVVLTVTWTE